LGEVYEMPLYEVSRMRLFQKSTLSFCSRRRIY